MAMLMLEAEFMYPTLISCSLFHSLSNLARLPHYYACVQLVGYYNDFFMAGQADLSTCIQTTCIQVTISFHLECG